TTVRLFLPQAAAVDTAAPRAPVAHATGGQETILVVEDNELMRGIVAKQLKSLGYEVILTDGPEAALAVLRSGRPSDLLFTDIVWPGQMAGVAAAREAQRLCPDLLILPPSGFPENVGGEVLRASRLLGKPYRREQLAELIRGLLDARTPHRLA